MTLAPPIGILGGTFDPIHLGHLRTAVEIQEAVKLQHIRFIPCKQPVHRAKPIATPDIRLHLLTLALANEPDFLIDEREITRDTPSYMITTLQSLRTDFPDTPLCLMMGLDVFLSLHTWHQWEQLLDYAHIIIAHRPPQQLAELTAAHPVYPLFSTHRVATPEAMHQQLHGLIHCVPTTELMISANQIRRLIKAGHSPRYLIPDAVTQYLSHDRVYG
jgi:nicotinate-nucleotide adenylyltransferase